MVVTQRKVPTARSTSPSNNGMEKSKSSYASTFALAIFILAMVFSSIASILLYTHLYPLTTSPCSCNNNSNDNKTNLSTTANVVKPVVEVVHHHPKKPANVHIANTTMDACPLLMQCFPGADSIFSDITSCHRNMEYLANGYDSSAYIQDGHVLGFTSFHLLSHRKLPGKYAVLVYNVCVDPKVRGQGVARRLLEEGVAEMVKFYGLPTDQRLLLGLDVDLATPMAGAAFAMYAKMGFLRAWQTCPSVGNVDWRPIFEQTGNYEAGSSSPLSALIDDTHKYIANVMESKDTPRMTPLYQSNKVDRLDHFCMFKFYNDSWFSLGNMLAEPFQPEEDSKEYTA